MENKAERYFELKRRQKETEEELAKLRGEIIELLSGQGLDQWDEGEYRIKLINQQRRDYNDQQLYQALPDPEVWKLLSKADPSKISSLIKLNVISEQTLAGTYAVKNVALLQVEKK